VTAMSTDTPELSIVIPVFNEEGILHAAVDSLLEGLADLGRGHEIILAENGSTDRTVTVAEEVSRKHPSVKLLSLGQPNYGAALKRGILEARGTYIVCDEIDLCDVDFYRRALEILEQDRADLVVGSKVMSGAADQRPMFRHTATLVVNGLLRVLVGFRGTDTHGLKAMRRERLRGTVERCVVDRDLFASELVIRADREGLRVTEIPIEIVEKRKPSINLLRRVPNVLKNLARLTYIFRVRG
jgi:glycosyltransferase involved in cell wall biosynthesis